MCCPGVREEKPEDLGPNVAPGRRLYEQVGQLTVIRFDNPAPVLFPSANP